jgi:2'-5' RNA ligase
MRLFVAVQPPESVLDALVEVIDEFRDVADLRWVERAQLHVTLRFLGEVPDDYVPRLVESLDAAPLAAAEAVLGPAVTRLGRQVLCVPVQGLGSLAAVVAAATEGFGAAPPEDRPFHGHVTLARARDRRGVVDRAAAGGSIEARWRVMEVELVRSRLGPGGPRYEVLRAFPALGA